MSYFLIVVEPTQRKYISQFLYVLNENIAAKEMMKSHSCC